MDSTTAEGVKVKEFGTPAVYAIYVSEKDPVQMVMAPGESAKLGDYTVKVLAVTAETATVELVSKTGAVTKKVLGPLNHETEEYLPTDHVNKANMIVRPKTDEVQVFRWTCSAFLSVMAKSPYWAISMCSGLPTATSGRLTRGSRFAPTPEAPVRSISS